MNGISNLEGSLMKKNEQVLSFKIDRGNLSYLEIVQRDLLPVDFILSDNDRRAFMVFLDERVVPSTRIKIDEDLKKVGIPYYDKDRILRFNHGRSVEDDYWIRFKDGEQTYEELIERLDSIQVD